MSSDLYTEKQRRAEQASLELEIREGRAEAAERPLSHLPDDELERLSRWDPEQDPDVIEDLGGGVTLRKRKQRSTARRRLKAEPEGETPDDALERERQEPKAEAEPPAKRTRAAHTPPQRKQARIALGEGLSWLIGIGGTGLQLSGRGPAVGRALAFEAPVAGNKLDALIAGTMIDRLAQPLARAGKMGADLGSVLALPLLVGLIERQPHLYPVLKPVLKPMVVEMYIEVQEAGARAAKRLEAAQKRDGGEKINADAIMRMLFEGEQPETTESE